MASAERDSGIVIHGRRFRENSRILEVFTRHHGRIAVVARVPKKHPHRVLGQYQPFQQVEISWSGRTDLQTLRSLDSQGSWALAGKAGICGMYCNELLLYLTRKHIPMEALYDQYAATLSRLQQGDKLAESLRRFEFVLLDELGYSPLFHEDCLSGESLDLSADDEQALYFHPVQGVSRQHLGQGTLAISAATLADLEAGNFSAKSTAKQIRLLLAAIIQHLLNGKALQSKSLIHSLSQQRP